VARVDGRDVEDEEQDGQQADGQHEADDHRRQLPALVPRAERHVRHQREAEHQTEAEANEVGIVVDHRQQAGHEHEDSHRRQPADGPDQARRVVRPPVGEDLDKEARKDSKLRSGRTGL